MPADVGVIRCPLLRPSGHAWVHVRCGSFVVCARYCKHRKAQNDLVIFADEVVPRHITCGVPLDYDTFFGADKFGNIFADRLPEDANEVCVRVLFDSFAAIVDETCPLQPYRSSFRA